MSPRLRKVVTRLTVGVPLAVIAVVALVVALGPGGQDSAQAQGPFTGGADPKEPYDLQFIDEMTMHHAGAIMSSEAMIARSARPELRDLARRIQLSQKRQIDQMQAWRRAWYPRAGAAPMAGMGMMSGDDGRGMMGMGGTGTASRGDGRMRGDQSDRMFLRMMIPHHQLAVDMGEDALDNAEHDELKRLAREIIDGQSAEIAEMERYLKAWYGEDSTRDLAGPIQKMMRGMMGGMSSMGGMGRP